MMRLEGLSEAIAQVQGSTSEDTLQAAAAKLSKWKDKIREEMQNRTSGDISAIIVKLKDDKPISPSELGLVRTWVVGDAESYARAETDFQSWLNELDRLKGVIAGFEKRECSVDDLVSLQGILEDTIRLCYDVANLQEKRERVRMFDDAMTNPVKLNRKLLAHVLQRKLESDQL